MLEGVDLILGVTIGTVACGVAIVVGALQLISRVRIREVQNNDTIAKRWFSELLAEAKKRMIVYDDGNDDEHSLYNDAGIIEKIREKLRATPGLRIDCVFNDDDETLFTRAFGDNPQVSIRLRLSNRQRIHYKIIDGRKGYISRHDHGSPERDAKFVDATAMWPILSRWLIFRRYFDDHRRYA